MPKKREHVSRFLTFGRLWNGLRSVPACRRNCSFATANCQAITTHDPVNRILPDHVIPLHLKSNKQGGELSFETVHYGEAARAVTLHRSLPLHAILKKRPQTTVRFAGSARGIENKLVPREGYPLDTIEIIGMSRSMSPKGHSAQSEGGKAGCLGGSARRKAAEAGQAGLRDRLRRLCVVRGGIARHSSSAFRPCCSRSTRCPAR